MNPREILLFDRLVGTPLCAALSAVERVARRFRGPSQPPRRILFIKLIEMGSTVIACPAFAEAMRRVGRENLFIMVFEENRAILDVLPFFPPEHIITVRRDTMGAFADGLRRALARVRREKIDTAIDLEGLTRSSAIITWLTRARNRVGYHNFTSEGPYRGRLFTHELNYGFQRHMSLSFLAMVRAAFSPDGAVPRFKECVADADLSLPAFEPSAAERDRVRGVIEGQTGQPLRGPLVLINPNCSDLLPLRRWDTARFVDLAGRILGDIPGSVVAVTGAPSEREANERVADAVAQPGRCISMAGRTTFRDLLTLYGLSDVLVSNDSGPCHFAALTPLSVVSLFGPETPQLYAAMGPRAISVTADLACSPCVNMLNHRFSPCTDNRCMQAITVDRVYEEVRRALAARPPRA